MWESYVLLELLQLPLPLIILLLSHPPDLILSLLLLGGGLCSTFTVKKDIVSIMVGKTQIIPLDEKQKQNYSTKKILVQHISIKNSK